MPELRWILLVLGAVLVAGLWWWESKRSAAKNAPPPDVEPIASGASRHEPTFGGAPAADSDASPIDAPSMRADERAIPRGDPPVVTLADLPEDTDRIVLASSAPEPRRVEPMSARRDVPGTVVPEIVTIDDDEGPEELPSMRADARVPAVGADSMRAESSTRPNAGARAVGGDERPPTATPIAAAPVASGTSTRTPATTPSAAAPVATPGAALASPPASATGGGRPAVPPVAAASKPPASQSNGGEARRPAARTAPAPERRDDAKPPEPPSPLQKIVALRLVAADGQRIEGARLRAALEAEGLRFGKYSIFHRQRADGRAIYSVASLLEPGSFDIDRMEGEQYPGVSMFAVFPGPIDAPEAFDELLASARRLTDRLQALPQDERGGPLSAQRALAIREELVHFQGLVNKTRRPSA